MWLQAFNQSKKQLPTEGLGQASLGETSTEVPGPGQAFGAHRYQGKH